jgi:hypothetical protein
MAHDFQSLIFAHCAFSDKQKPANGGSAGGSWAVFTRTLTGAPVSSGLEPVLTRNERFVAYGSGFPPAAQAHHRRAVPSRRWPTRPSLLRRVTTARPGPLIPLPHSAR